MTAWLNLLGLITVLGAINIGTAFFFTGTFGSLIGMTGTPGEIVIFVGVITVIQAAINHLGIRLTTLLTDWSGYIILGTTAALIVLCLVLAPTHDFSRLWTFTNFSGEAGGNVWPQSDSLIYLLALSLLLPIYTITGYDASAHTSEETYKAAPFGAARHCSFSAVVLPHRLGDGRSHRDRHSRPRRGRQAGLECLLLYHHLDHAGRRRGPGRGWLGTTPVRGSTFESRTMRRTWFGWSVACTLTEIRAVREPVEVDLFLAQN